MKTYALTINGYSFEVYAEPKYITEYLLAGIDIEEITHTIPEWYVDSGLPLNWWCTLQDLRLIIK
jgi:hypothetical protein